MTLGQKQRKFSLMVARLIEYAYSLGYEISIGHAERSPEEAARLGFRNSNHTRKIAIDLHLFKDGVYLRKTEDHAPLGRYWEAMGGSWGGHFGDGNHYSIEHNGVR